MLALDLLPAAVTGQTTPVVLRLLGMTRRLGASMAVHDVDLDLKAGEIVALLGESGAGKSTLLDMIGGRDQGGFGAIQIAPKHGGSPPLPESWSRRAAIDIGVGLLRHDLALAANLSGLDNILLAIGSYWSVRRSYRSALSKVSALQQRFDLGMDLKVSVDCLGARDRLRLAMLRLLLQNPRILLLDEPFALLNPQEGANLSAILKTLAAEGRAILIATRIPDEALAVADRIVVLRAGVKVADVPNGSRDAQALVSLMAGLPLQSLKLSPVAAGAPLLELSRVTTEGNGRSSLHDVSLRVRAGEIIGIAGSPGHGQRALADVASGLIAPTRGSVKLHGRTPRRHQPALFVRAGICRIPADCRSDGIVATMSVAENLVLEDLPGSEFRRYGFLNKAVIRIHAAEVIERYRICNQDPNDAAATLTDAEMHKLVLARGFERRPYVIIADNPCRDLDLATRYQVHQRLIEEHADGAAILLISDDLDELLRLSDYIGVLYNGRLSIPQPTPAFDRRSLGFMMGGHGSMAQDWSGWGGGL